MEVDRIQWAPSGNPFDGTPGAIMRFLSKDGKTFGYGYGPGWSMGFGSDQGDIYVEPKQWIVKHDDGRITVEDDQS